MAETKQDAAPVEPVIEVTGLGKTFGTFTAVDDLSFSVEKGEILGLLGPNGAGKTTTIHMLLGLTTPSRGRIKILGMDLATHRREILSRVNFSSAYTSLPANVLVRENLEIFARLYGIRNFRDRTMELLDIFELTHAAKKRTGSLSSGQTTRLNLCKAFINDPEVLFLDEPTASLDPDIADKVRDRLFTLQQKKNVTMIYTSHNMSEVKMMCDRLLFLAHGRTIISGSPEAVLAKANSASLEELFIRISRNGNPGVPAKEELP